MADADWLKGRIRDVADFPTLGVVFRDLTPLLADAEALRFSVDTLADAFGDRRIDKVIGVEARGFIVAAPVAYRIGAGFVPVRKPGKLPWRTASEQYALEYGVDSLEMHDDALEPGEVLGVRIVADVADLPDGAVDLVFVCTPAPSNPDLLRACAKKGVKAAFIASAGYGEAGPEGEQMQTELVALAEELDLLEAGPNGQGVVSTPARMCAQIVAPYPPAGRIGIASQSGNFVSSFLNYAAQTDVGVSRAVSAGNAAAVTIPDFLEFYASDDATDVALAYVEGVQDGRGFYERAKGVAARKPLVLVKGGATAGGQKAAASHTGSLASDDRVFDGMCRQAG
ncbi:MAG: adenine phosphoribosyltransferase, partial [Acidimicrobiales bacterium]|nr:adenine phosphoribosyltransferase [Acidimicrobiales bacterium]